MSYPTLLTSRVRSWADLFGLAIFMVKDNIHDDVSEMEIHSRKFTAD